MKKIILLLTLLLSCLSFAQTVNDYKYIVMPEQFEFLSEKNQYNLNLLTKMMFEKQGFKVFYPNDEMPQELALNRCNALYADVVKDSNILTTKLFITLNDCKGKNIFTSVTGKSKQKEFKQAYYEALREAAKSVEVLSYNYSGNDAAAVTTQVAPVPQAPVTPAAPATPQATPVDNANVLFAQPIANGYQLVDTTPKVVLKMFKTSQPDSYTAHSESRNGVVFKKGNEWFFEYYENDVLKSEKLNIKF